VFAVHAQQEQLPQTEEHARNKHALPVKQEWLMDHADTAHHSQRFNQTEHAELTTATLDRY